MNDTSEKILQKIAEDNVRPIARGRILLKRILLWVVICSTMIFGIISSGIALFQLSHTDWDLYDRVNRSAGQFIVLALPYFWLFLLVLCTVLALYYFRRSRKGYRYSALLLIMLAAFFSLAGGSVLYYSGFSLKLEKAFEEVIPLYERVTPYGYRIWSYPERGLFSGRILAILSPEEIRVADSNGNIWRVDISETLWRGGLSAAVGLEIKCIGAVTGTARFAAQEIRPMHSRGHRRRFGRIGPSLR